MREMTIAAVQHAINLLESIDPLEELAYERAFLAYMTVSKLPVVIYNIVEKVEVFRARTHFDDIFFNDIKDISLAPHDAITKFARCNRPYQSRFYGASNRPTAYMELANYWADEKAVDEHLFVTIGRWLVKKPFSALVISTPDPKNRISEYDKIHGAAIDELINEQQGEEREATILMYRYLFTKFRKPAKKDLLTYIITTAYCNVALSTIPNPDAIDAIFYPSVPYGGKGVNFAFNNRFVRNDNIELLDALRDEFKVYISEENKKSFQQVGQVQANEIVLNQNQIQW